MIERLKALQANKEQFTHGGGLFAACRDDEALRHEIDVLAGYYLSRTVSGCSNCYMDAYIELINYKLEKAMAKEECNFKLKAGALLHDVKNYDNSLLCSNANLTNDLALYHLKTNPNYRNLFEKLPDNVDDLVGAYKLPGEEPPLTEEGKARIKAEKAEQQKAEKDLVAEIVALLTGGTTKTDIREKFKGVEKVGTEKLTQRFLNDLIKRADEELAKAGGEQQVLTPANTGTGQTADPA